MNPVSNIYDALFAFESKNREEAYPIHKKIEYQGMSLLEWLEEELSLSEGMRILDAGCGTGNTLFYFHKRYKAEGVGLTLSQQEVDFANAQAAKWPEADLQFLKRDFASSLDDLGAFDLIICIESLKHGPEPEQVVKNLAKQLKPGGRIVVVDDLLTSSEMAGDDIARHKKLWHAPGFVSREQMEQMISGALGKSPDCTDLSASVPAKSPFARALTIGLLRLIRLLLSSKRQFRRNIDTYWGAMLLESLYASKKVGYFTFIGEKQGQ